ncbi:MAG: hypothetical protein KDK27_19450, partial [Leptospiraceae bacterium]|nr:hypothetical protein [Leptospiraceae bacterium]
MITAYETDTRPLSGLKIHTGQIVLIGDDRTADTFTRLIGPRIDASAVIRVKEMSESLNRIRGCRNPLVILDQSQTGAQFLDQVRNLSEHAPVITLCQSPEMTEQALAAGAVDSILPPYPTDRIRTALHKVHRYCVNKNGDGFLNFRQSDRSISLRYNQIVCVVSEKKRSHIELSNGNSFLSTHLLKDLHSRLPEESFIRV